MNKSSRCTRSTISRPNKRGKAAKETFAVGDYVHIDSLNAHGEILEIRKNKPRC